MADMSLTDARTLRRLPKDLRPIVKNAGNMGWTGRPLGNGGVLLRSPDGTHQVSVPITIGDSHTVANVAREVLKHTPRELQLDYAERVADELDAGRRTAAEEIVSMITAAEDNAFGAKMGNLIATEAKPYVKSEKPFLSRQATKGGVAELYESPVIVERTWSDGHVDYKCARCDYTSERHMSIIGHQRAHRSQRPYRNEIVAFEPNAQPRYRTGIARLANELTKALSQVTRPDDWWKDPAPYARKIAEAIYAERSENQRAEVDDEPLDDGEVLDRIKRMLLRNEAVDRERDMAPLRQQIEALSSEVVALQAAYEAENDARQKAQEDARRARETLATLAALANEEGGTNGRGA